MMNEKVKIYVNHLPTEAKECPFAQLPSYFNETDFDLIPNCQFKCNTFPMTDGYHFSYIPSRFNCSLADDKECPYLVELFKEIN